VSGSANALASNFAGSGTTYTFDVVKNTSDGDVDVKIGSSVATDSGGNSNVISNTYSFSPVTFSSGASTSTGTCSRHVILGNCGTIAINNDEYRIINTWTNVPTTEVLVGQPVTVTLSTPNNPTHTKIHFASVHTEVFSIPANFDQTAHIDYSIMSDSYSVTKAKLFQVAAATHRITQDPDVKNLEMFEVVFTMIFAKPMDTSHVVVETQNKFGIPETLYLMSALKVNENLAQALTLEEKSKFSIVEPEMDPEPEIEMDPEPEQTKKEKSKRQRR
jgi:xanthine/uracil/vitamin C permease (AzgA family)